MNNTAVMNNTAHPNRLLIIKHGALGDIVQGFDAFASLRSSFPDAHISLLTGPAFSALMQKSLWFDDVIIDKRAPFWNFAATLSVWRALSRQWDFIIDLQCSKRTSRYFTLSSSKTSWVGTVSGCSHPVGNLTGINNAERMLIAAEQAGARRVSASTEWLVPETSVDLGFSDKPYAVFFAGCSPAKPSKRWPSEHYAAVAKSALKRGFHAVLAGTSQDRQAINSILEICPDAIDISGKTSISELAGVLAGAEFVVGNDTGPVFLAARCNVPVLMVMGSDTDPSMSAPLGPHSHYIHSSDIRSITSAMVMKKLDDILKNQARLK